jgi:hypothetical protein
MIMKMSAKVVFYDANGTVLFRQTGFIRREDVFGKWKELSAELAAAAKK